MTTHFIESVSLGSAMSTELGVEARLPRAADSSTMLKRFPKWEEKAADIAAIDRAVHDEIRNHAADGNPLDQMVRYAVATPGKMLRGLMLVEACKAVGGDPDKVLPAAAGTEFGHLASLIHDDIIDQDETRRGRNAVWRKYGIDNAILVGDLFIFYAYHALAQCRDAVGAERVVRVMEVLSKACVELCLGQAHEAKVTGNCAISVEEYMQVVRGKTGSLFRVAAESGAILGGGTDAQIEAVRDYAEWLGMAYQIIDDLLSYEGDDAALLKSTKSDVKNRRMTLPVLYALETATKRDRDLLVEIFGGAQEEGDLATSHAKVCEILTRTKALTRAKTVALDLLDRALERISTLPANDGRTCLTMIAHMATHRTR